MIPNSSPISPARAHVRRLSEVRVGETVRIIGLEQGRGFQMRLVSMGLTPGTTVRVVQKAPGGPCIVATRGTRIALGRGMLDRIRVESTG